MVRALAKMTPERMKTMSEALLSIVISFLIKNCPQKPARTDTAMRYKAAKKRKTNIGRGIIPRTTNITICHW